MARRRWAANTRSRARTQIRVLMRADGYRCHWCRVSLMILSDVPGTIVGGDSQQVLWVDEPGRLWASWLATIDHLMPLRDYQPGPLLKHRVPPNHPSNLVVSCAPCNQARGAVGEALGVDVRSSIE